MHNPQLWIRDAGEARRIKVPTICIVDTNVFLGVAQIEKITNENQLRCALECVKVLNGIKDNPKKKIVVDMNSETKKSDILSEYCHKLNPYNGKSLAEIVLKLLHDENRIVYRKITPQHDNDYVEFPHNRNLSGFDVSDKKFVATSCSQTPHYPIIQSMDGKWWKWSKPLKEHCVDILFTNPDYAKDICKRKNRCDGDCLRCSK
jgi:hypothetical protein